MEIEEFIEKLQEWHANKVRMLKKITEHKDAVMQIGDMEIAPGTDMAKGFRAGVHISLALLGKLPISVSRGEGDTDDGIAEVE